MSRFALMACLCVTLLIAPALGAERPNILLITADDMNCDCVGVFGCPIKGTTPAVPQRLAQRPVFSSQRRRGVP